MNKKYLEHEMAWIDKYYGSDAKERKSKGSKRKQQRKRLVDFISQMQTAQDLIDHAKLDLVKIIPATVLDNKIKFED